MSDKEKGRRISVRLDMDTAEKLEKIMNARGIAQSDALRLCINGARILQIGDVTNLALEFCKIRTALETNYFDEDIKKEVAKLCRSISDVLLQTEGLLELENV